MTLPVLHAAQQLLLGHVDGAVSFDLVHVWKVMGPFARAIVVVLALMSAYSLGIVAERLVTFSRARRASRSYADALRELLPAARFGDAVELSRRLGRGHLPKVLGVAIDEYRRGRGAPTEPAPADPGSFDVIAAVNRCVERSALRTVNDLRRGLGALATIGSSAPFVGLLGTVAGIIAAFQAMAATGSGGLASVSAGIAEALVTTAFGLLVAIPAVMTFNYLTNRVEDMQVDITDAASELVDFLVKHGRAAR